MLALAALVTAACGQQRSGGAPSAARAAATPAAPAAQAHPQAIEPVAGSVPANVGAASSGPAAVSVGPSGSSGGGSLPQPVSLDEVRAELTQSGLTANPDQAELTPSGLAIAPIAAPGPVQEIINAGNEIAHLPYRWGGGHGAYEDTAYDCSGSLSYVLAAAGLLNTTVTSGELESWGDPGPGKWITIFANAGHTFMYVAGLRFDTVALAETGTRWSNRSANEPDLRTFYVRHPPGL